MASRILEAKKTARITIPTPPPARTYTGLLLKKLQHAEIVASTNQANLGPSGIPRPGPSSSRTPRFGNNQMRSSNTVLSAAAANGKNGNRMKSSNTVSSVPQANKNKQGNRMRSSNPVISGVAASSFASEEDANSDGKGGTSIIPSSDLSARESTVSASTGSSATGYSVSDLTINPMGSPSSFASEEGANSNGNGGTSIIPSSDLSAGESTVSASTGSSAPGYTVSDLTSSPMVSTTSFASKDYSNDNENGGPGLSTISSPDVSTAESVASRVSSETAYTASNSTIDLIGSASSFASEEDANSYGKGGILIIPSSDLSARESTVSASTGSSATGYSVSDLTISPMESASSFASEDDPSACGSDGYGISMIPSSDLSARESATSACRLSSTSSAFGESCGAFSFHSDSDDFPCSHRSSDCGETMIPSSEASWKDSMESVNSVKYGDVSKEHTLDLNALSLKLMNAIQDGKCVGYSGTQSQEEVACSARPKMVSVSLQSFFSLDHSAPELKLRRVNTESCLVGNMFGRHASNMNLEPLATQNLDSYFRELKSCHEKAQWKRELLKLGAQISAVGIMGVGVWIFRNELGLIMVSIWDKFGLAAVWENFDLAQIFKWIKSFFVEEIPPPTWYEALYQKIMEAFASAYGSVSTLFS